MTADLGDTSLPRYDIHRSYEWNYEHAPEPRPLSECRFPGQWRFCGLPVNGPLGIAAGPLLNGAWCLYYASLGWSVLTYKTVRSVARACYPMPNLQPVSCLQLSGEESEVCATEHQTGTWAVSFGMPSQHPDVWRRDVEQTRRRLPSGFVLVVSVVGTVQPGWSIHELANDYAQCARWAIDSGADAVEANFSCPNVSTCDGQLYQHHEDAQLVAAAIRQAIPGHPLIIKAGQLVDMDTAELLLRAIAPYATAVSMTNSIALPVRDDRGTLMFQGARRGICGRAILEMSVAQVRLAHEIVSRLALPLEIIGVGGVFTADDVRTYIDAGAHAVQCATAAMLQPDLVQQLCRDWTID